MNFHARLWLPIVIGVVGFPVLVHELLGRTTGLQHDQLESAATFDGTVSWIVPSLIMGFLLGALVGVTLSWAHRPPTL